MPSHPELLRSLIGRSSFAALHAQLDHQARLLQAVRQGLPDFLRGHCLHCVARDDRLLLYVDSPAFASQIRFFGPSLLAQLEQAAGQRFREIQVRNRLPTAADLAGRPRAAAAPPAPRVAEILRQSAANAPDDIRDALLRLGRTLERARAEEES